MLEPKLAQFLAEALKKDVAQIQLINRLLEIPKGLPVKLALATVTGPQLLGLIRSCLVDMRDGRLYSNEVSKAIFSALIILAQIISGADNLSL
jgi:hypothetical protein